MHFISATQHTMPPEFGGSWRTEFLIETECLNTRIMEMKYLFKFIFLFLCSGVEAKQDVKFRHSAHNASRIRRKFGNEMS